MTQGGRDAFLFAVGGSYIVAIFFGPIGAYIGKLDGEKEVLSLREKNVKSSFPEEKNKHFDIIVRGAN